jgi:hypothetical protein
VARKDWILPIDLNSHYRIKFAKTCGWTYGGSWHRAIGGDEEHTIYMEWLLDVIEHDQILARLRGESSHGT